VDAGGCVDHRRPRHSVDHSKSAPGLDVPSGVCMCVCVCVCVCVLNVFSIECVFYRIFLYRMCSV
jgi:hypothetical protein